METIFLVNAGNKVTLKIKHSETCLFNTHTFRLANQEAEPNCSHRTAEVSIGRCITHSGHCKPQPFRYRPPCYNTLTPNSACYNAQNASTPQSSVLPSNITSCILTAAYHTMRLQSFTIYNINIPQICVFIHKLL